MTSKMAAYAVWQKQRGQIYYSFQQEKKQLLTLKAPKAPKVFFLMSRILGQDLTGQPRELLINLIKALGLDPSSDAGLIYIEANEASAPEYQKELFAVCRSYPNLGALVNFGPTVFAGQENYYQVQNEFHGLALPFLALPSVTELIEYPELKRPSWASLLTIKTMLQTRH